MKSALSLTGSFIAFPVLIQKATGVFSADVRWVLIHWPLCRRCGSKKIYPDVILSLAIPCETQSARWQESDKRIYARILEQADEKTILSPHYYQGVMLTRNRYMADRSSLCICYLSHMRGGTAYTVRYALQSSRINIVNLAVDQDISADIMREKTWNYIYTYPSAERNAATVPLRLLSGKKLILKHM